jgi:hypothetical protein
MVKKIRLNARAARKLAERERTLGLKPEDEAARWLAEHDQPAQPQPPKAGLKSRNLHRWRQRRQRGG